MSEYAKPPESDPFRPRKFVSYLPPRLVGSVDPDVLADRLRDEHPENRNELSMILSGREVFIMTESGARNILLALDQLNYREIIATQMPPDALDAIHAALGGIELHTDYALVELDDTLRSLLIEQRVEY